MLTVNTLDTPKPLPISCRLFSLVHKLYKIQLA